MGSFGEGDYGKGENPALNWVQVGINRHNAACHDRAMAAPLRLKILAGLGFTKPYYRWQECQSLRHYYPRSIPPSLTAKADSDKIAEFIEENGVTKVEPKFVADVSSALPLAEEQSKLKNLVLREPRKLLYGRSNSGR